MSSRRKIETHNRLAPTTRVSSAIFSVLFSALLTTTIGCGVPAETLETIRHHADTSATNRSTASALAEVNPVSVTFDPEYPDRIDPFSYPIDSSFETQGIDTSIKSAAQVDVVGFADLGKPRVFLLAREKTHSLSVGDQLYGVTVVDISPPSVRLRMGSLTWTATMFDRSSGQTAP